MVAIKNGKDWVLPFDLWVDPAKGKKILQSDYICFNLSMNDKIIVRSIVDADVCGNGGGYFINLKKTKLVLI